MVRTAAGEAVHSMLRELGQVIATEVGDALEVTPAAFNVALLLILELRLLAIEEMLSAATTV